MILEWLHKILFLGMGYIFGMIFGLIIGTSGIYQIINNDFLFPIFSIASFIGFVSLFILLRNDTKIEKIKQWKA